MKKQLLTATLAAAIVGGSMIAPAMADDGLSGSASVASSYLWRGYDLGDGSAAVSGDLSYSMAGAYAGIWISSGDTTFGTEYDYYAGYGLEAGGVGIDLSVWNYNYSDGCTNSQNLSSLGNAVAFPIALSCDSTDDTTGQLSEVILSLSFAGASFSVYDNVAGGTGYEYYTLGYGMDKYSATLGYHDAVGGADNVSHLDLGYAFNDNLSFTVSKIISGDDAGATDNDAIFMVSYSLPM